jgi:hypothetical protein
MASAAASFDNARPSARWYESQWAITRSFHPSTSIPAAEEKGHPFVEMLQREYPASHRKFDATDPDLGAYATNPANVYYTFSYECYLRYVYGAYPRADAGVKGPRARRHVPADFAKVPSVQIAADALSLRLGGKRAVARGVDVITRTDVIAVCDAKDASAALGRLLVGARGFPHHAKALHMYGASPSPDVRDQCAELDVAIVRI